MITYDLLFALMLVFILPVLVFFCSELFIQEVPAREQVDTGNIKQWER